MSCNVGDMDRMVRIIVGLVIIGWGLATHSWWGLIGLIPIFTGTLAVCPLYMPLGLSTK